METSTTRASLRETPASSDGGRWSSPSDLFSKIYRHKKAQASFSSTDYTDSIYLCNLWMKDFQMVLLRSLLLLTLALTAFGAPQRTSGNPDTLLSEAGALVQAGKLAEEEAATRKILTTHPRNAEAHRLLGVILDQRGGTAEIGRAH